MTESDTSLESTLASLTDEELAAYYAAARTAYYAADHFGRRSTRFTFKAASLENSRRVWNRTPMAARAEQTLYSVQQGSPDWYLASTWQAMTDWVDGLKTALEACEAYGECLADR